MNSKIRRLVLILSLLTLLLPAERASAYYDPGVQRWINRDPIAEGGGVNLHAYVGNCPLTRLDALGLDSVQVPTINLPPDPGPHGPVGYPGHVPIIIGNGPPASPVPPYRPKLPRCSPEEANVPRNLTPYAMTCPCTAVVVNCLKWETCETVQTRVGTQPMPPDYYWVPHHKCPNCPEGNYDPL